MAHVALKLSDFGEKVDYHAAACDACHYDNDNAATAAWSWQFYDDNDGLLRRGKLIIREAPFGNIWLGGGNSEPNTRPVISEIEQRRIANSTTTRHKDEARYSR